MQLVQFSIYYLQLRTMTALGFSATDLPHDWTWRYNLWQRRIEPQKRTHGAAPHDTDWQELYRLFQHNHMTARRT